MRNSFLLLGLLALAGCAASNGGGHVVGNSIVPQSAGGKMAKNSKNGCACAPEKKGEAANANCPCAGAKTGN